MVSINVLLFENFRNRGWSVAKHKRTNVDVVTKKFAYVETDLNRFTQLMFNTISVSTFKYSQKWFLNRRGGGGIEICEVLTGKITLVKAAGYPRVA